MFCNSDSLRLFLKNLCIDRTNYLCKTECSVAPPLTVESKDARYNTRGNFTCLNNEKLLLYGKTVNKQQLLTLFAKQTQLGVTALSFHV